MRGYYIRPTRVTPSVYYKKSTNTVLDVRGRSCPKNPMGFYTYLHKSLDDFETSESQTLKVNMAFEYFNTSSAKCLFNFMNHLQKLIAKGKVVSLNWYYEQEDDDMQEAGDDLSCFFDYEFNFIEIPEIVLVGEPKETQLAA